MPYVSGSGRCIPLGPVLEKRIRMSLSCLRLCHLVVLATWACASSFVIAAEPQEARSSSYSLSQAEAYLASIRTADYSFSCSYYEKPIRVRLDGIMIRCDSQDPTSTSASELVLAPHTYAFNGVLYQNRDDLGGTMSARRIRSDHTTDMSGPCWTPLEYIYRWCRTKDVTYSWEGLRAPSLWGAIRKLANPECQSVTLDMNGESIECDVITFTHSSQITSKVYLARTKGFLPVRDEVYNSSSEMSGPVFKMEVEKLVSIGELDSRVWFPAAISANTLWLPPDIPASPGEHVSYTIDANTVRLNESIDEKVFTLDYKGIREVYLDDDQVYLPEKDKTVAINETSPDSQPQHTSDKRSWLPVLIISNIVVILTIIIVTRIRRS